MNEGAIIGLSVGATVATLVCLGIGTFLWNLWLAPYRLLEERLDSASSSPAIGSLNEPLPSPEKAVIADYQQQREFHLYEAACLWAGIKPHYPIRDSRSEAIARRLKSAIRTGEMQCRWGGGFLQLTDSMNGVSERTPSDQQRVQAAHLRAYADRIKDVPEFLQHVQPPETPEPITDQASDS